MHTFGSSWSCEKHGKGACVCAHSKKLFFFLQKLWSVSLCVLSEGGLHWNASVSGLSLGGLHWPSIRQSLCVSRSSVNACGLPKDSALSLISASPSSAETWSNHDWTNRVGSRRWLVLETACSDAQCNCNAHALPCTNLQPLGGGACYCSLALYNYMHLWDLQMLYKFYTNSKIQYCYTNAIQMLYKCSTNAIQILKYNIVGL